MIVPDNIHPENTLYFLGSVVLGQLRENGPANPFLLYERIRSERAAVRISVFLLCLDWLFLVGAISLDDNGSVAPCI